MKKSVIKAIELEVGGKTLKLSPDEAKELYRALGDLIGEPCNRPHTWWYQYPTYSNGTASVYGNSTGNLNVPNMGMTRADTVETTTATARLGDNWSYTAEISNQ